MHAPTQTDVNRIYQGFNDAYRSGPGRYRFPHVERSCDNENAVRLELNRDFALGHWELFRPHSDMLVCITEGVYHSRFHQSILPRQNVVSIRFVLSSGLNMSFERVGEVSIPQTSASVSYTHKNQAFDLCIDNGSHLSSVTFHIKPEFLFSGFGIRRDRLPMRLVNILSGQGQDTDLFTLPLSSGMVNNVLDMLNMPYRGVRRGLFAEAKTAELICRFFHEVEASETVGRRSPKPRQGVKDKVISAQKILQQNYVSPPTVAELARQTGLNRSLLSAEFKQLFGATISRYCQEYRMNKAREYLQGGDLTVAQVAELVGYDHPTNFTSAFKRHFGFRPKDLRRA